MPQKIGNLPDAAVLVTRSQSLIARREIYEEIITADGAIFERKLDGGADSSIRWGHGSYVRHATDPVDAGSEPAGFNTARHESLRRDDSSGSGHESTDTARDSNPGRHAPRNHARDHGSERDAELYDSKLHHAAKFDHAGISNSGEHDTRNGMQYHCGSGSRVGELSAAAHADAKCE